jgi:hypothetical protein
MKIEKKLYHGHANAIKTIATKIQKFYAAGRFAGTPGVSN